jgi:iron complex outermembrane receptor protein
MHIENSFSLTRGQNVKTKNNLPFIPAPNLRNEIRFEPEFGSDGLKNTYFSIGMENAFKQNRVDEEFETSTAGYTLLDAAAGTTLRLNKQIVKVYISANNLLDKSYVNHLNRLKYEGILNQGRNIAFGVQIPLTFQK